MFWHVSLPTVKSSGDTKIVKQLLANIKMVVFDFDGVFTDNRVLVSEDGRESVFCWRSDGVGLSRVKQLGVVCIVISSEENPVVSQRCDKLGIECVQSCEDKLRVLTNILAERQFRPEQVAFVGNDLGDLECMRFVGVPIAVADAYPQIKDASRMITNRYGGAGAVREVCDWVCEAQQEHE